MLDAWAFPGDAQWQLDLSSGHLVGQTMHVVTSDRPSFSLVELEGKVRFPQVNGVWEKASLQDRSCVGVGPRTPTNTKSSALRVCREKLISLKVERHFG